MDGDGMIGTEQDGEFMTDGDGMDFTDPDGEDGATHMLMVVLASTDPLFMAMDTVVDFGEEAFMEEDSTEEVFMEETHM